MAKQTNFEHANKTGRWLAYKLRKQTEKRFIHQLQDELGVFHHTHLEKKNITKQYYQKLYRQEDVPDDQIKQYLHKTKIIQFEEDHREILNRPITMFELEEARKKQKNNKTPGLDGIPVEFYKLCQEPIDQILLQVFNDALSIAEIPKSWTETIITLIHKEDSDPTQIRNYRPISLLNADYKLFMSIMSQRLKTIIHNYIHPDQNGFIPRRQIKKNLRTIMNILEYYDQKTDKEVAIISLDAQKAFDNLNWAFLIKQLELMKCGDKFHNLIQKIYSHQTAKIAINGDITQKFDIQKGVRQGCPMSPLLFIIALETLLNEIRKEKEVKGLKIRGEEYKLLAFADDVIFNLENPRRSGPKLIAMIEEYGKVAGLKINKQKTKVLTKNMTQSQKLELEEKLGIQIVKKIKYLGIWLTAKTTTIKEDNYTKLLKQIRKDLEIWNRIQLSLMGRINSIKMNILPRILFLYQVIPIHPGKDFFKNLNKITMTYIWQGKKPRIKIKALQDTRDKGGLALPNWELYYKAAGLTWIKDWIKLEDKRLLYLEGFDLLRGWHAFLWDGSDKGHNYFQHHIIRAPLYKIWREVKKNYYTKIPKWWSPMEALIHPNTLEIGKMIRYQDLLNNEGELPPKQQLHDRNINIDWWHYTQIHSRYTKDKLQYGIAKDWNDLDKILMGTDQKMITKIYNYLLRDKLLEETVKHNMITWARDIGHNIQLMDWENLWKRNIKITRSVTYKENLIKMFYRWHLPPARLAKIYPNTSALCWKCKYKKGTYYHVWWNCTKAQLYWQEIKKMIEEIINLQIENNPEFFLLGMIRTQYKKETTYLIIHLLTAARLLFAQNWKLDQIPNRDQIIFKINECAEMDRLTLALQDKEESDYYSVWHQWYKWLERNQT